jgi:hypothetical protein
MNVENQMVQVGPVTYDKTESSIFLRGFILGLIVGIPLWILVNHAYGFVTIPTHNPNGFVGAATTLTVVFMSSLVIPLVTTIAFLLLFFKRAGRLTSMKCFGRALWPVLVFFVFLPLYVALTSSLVLTPFYSVLYPFFGERWMATLYSLGFVAVLPFMVLFVAIVEPNSKFGRNLRILVNRHKGRKSTV